MQPEFELPDALIARFPPERRDGGRLYVLGQDPPHRMVRDLADFVQPGDLWVVNDTRVLRARLHGRRATGGRVEALLLGPGPGPVEALLKPAKKLRAGEMLDFEGGQMELLERVGAHWRVRTTPEPLDLMAACGAMPLPPYLGRAAEESDEERYQTLFARNPGAVAAPTAGLHLGADLQERMRSRGARFATITLHVGPGTFRPLRQEDLDRGRLHEESYEVPEATVQAISEARRVIAVGTTSTRALESAAADGVLRAGPGVSGLFIREGYRFRVVGGLLTNFHLPGSSLLRLVFALGGREAVLAAYREAIEHEYRFYSYGDAMLLL